MNEALRPIGGSAAWTAYTPHSRFPSAASCKRASAGGAQNTVTSVTSAGLPWGGDVAGEGSSGREIFNVKPITLKLNRGGFIKTNLKKCMYYLGGGAGCLSRGA